MASITAENYLKALYALAEVPRGPVAISTLAAHLGVSKPTANSMIRRLNEQGMLDYRKYQPLQLTAAGQRAAEAIVRKHRLTEMFLVEVMGFDEAAVHEIAEQIEHVQSPAFFARMDELMGFPRVDPHGSPIPGGRE